MKEKTITILDPVSKPKVKKLNINPRPDKIEGLRVATVDNTKQNFSIFLDKVEELLVGQYNVASVSRYRKPGRTQPVAPEVINEIKENCDIAIAGVGD